MIPQFYIFARAVLIFAAILPAVAIGQMPTMDALKRYPSAQKAFQKRMERAIAERDRYRDANRDAHLIVGRVQLHGNDDPETVISQMIIVEEGFFVEVIRDLNIPIGFRHFDYKPLDFTIPNDAPQVENGIVDVGIVRMSKASAADKGRISGNLSMEATDDARAARISITLRTPRPNTPSNGSEGVGRKYRTMTMKVGRDGTLQSEPVSEGDYYISLMAKGYVSASRRVTVKAGEDADFGPVRLELPQKIKITYRVLDTGEGTFADSEEIVKTFPAGHRWKATPDIYGWDLEFTQSEGKVKFAYSYAPCRIKDLGPGTLDDHLDALPEAAKDSPRDMKVTSGNVYLLNQQHWKHAVLFHVEIDGKVEPGEQVSSDVGAKASDHRHPNVIAHYEFNGNANELNGTGSAFDLENTQFYNGSLVLNGQYDRSHGGTGFRAIASTPDQNYQSFTFAIRFKAQAFSDRNRTILCGGTSSRWFNIGVGQGNAVHIELNNQRVTHTFKNLKLYPGRWHQIACAVDVQKGIVAVVVDKNRAEVFRLPTGFQFEVANTKYAESDKKWTFTNYSYANMFYGLVDELTILKGTMTAAEFQQTIAALKKNDSASLSNDR
ncbi:LamG domain-containing protein [Stieleria sp. JC731]|uniref:LamG domain-containing protein n=1 Tax=Pirellulaceae TaxID=2691357 RepID=UPI001E4D5E30|nr:LamG domain-containing protein [Stieleria sp. JC731]MCC9603398.1 LamG domain-containing protein [Stieleria sp. JC731]